MVLSKHTGMCLCILVFSIVQCCNRIDVLCCKLEKAKFILLARHLVFFGVQAISVLATAPAVPLASDRLAYLHRLIAVLPFVRPLLPLLRLVTVLSEIALALCPDSPDGQRQASAMFSEAADIVQLCNKRSSTFMMLLRRLALTPPKTLEEAAAAEVACSEAE
jgi:hypothetical protein